MHSHTQREYEGYTERSELMARCLMLFTVPGVDIRWLRIKPLVENVW